jgi:deoxyribonuclease-1
MKPYVLLFFILCSGLLYATQSPDFYEEDVATIDDDIFSTIDAPKSFSRSKRLLATKVYRFHEKAFYSDCDYQIKGKILVPVASTCGFEYRKNKERAKRIEWEHIVPAWEFGHQLNCWKQGGRKECGQTNEHFQEMEADMHNLVPAIGEINADRSNFAYGEIRGEKRVYGKVDMEIDSSKEIAEPREEIRGDIARIYFYMHDKYKIYIAPQQEKMFFEWNNDDPVDAWEKKKNLLVYNLQGDKNNYVSNYRKVKELSYVEPFKDEDFSKDSDFFATKREIEKKYDFIFNQFSPTVSEILILIITLFVLYYRKKKK